jgi:hypothetical protein
MKAMPIKTRSRKEESGIVAILVVIVFTALLAIISLSFSHLMNREVRQALDRQLNLQSYYSAESGLNDAKVYLKANPNAAPSNGCAAPSASPNPFVQSGDISGDAVAKYSCIIINPKPKEILFDLQPGESKVFKIDVSNMSNMYFSWQNKQYTGAKQPLGPFQSLPREDQLPSPDATGVLRTTLYGASRGGVLANANAVLTAGAHNNFLYPDSGAGTVGTIGSSSSDNGSFVHGNCNDSNHPTLPYSSSTPMYCNSEITGLQGTSYSYYVRIMAVYAPLSVSVQISDNSNNSLSIPNVEGIVDVTGTGNDVLSRIQARIPLSGLPFYPGYGIQSMMAVCKAFRVPADSLNRSGQPELDSVPNSDNACEIPTNLGALSGSNTPPFDDVPCGTNATGSWPSCACPPGWSGDPLVACTAPPPPPPPPSGECHVDSFSAPGGSFSWVWNCSGDTSQGIYGVISGPGGNLGVGQGGNNQFIFGPRPPGECYQLSVGAYGGNGGSASACT